MLMRLICIAEALQDASGIMGHCGVAAAFWNDDVAVAAGVHIGVKIIVSKECGQRHRPVEDLNLRLLCAEEKTSGVECLGVEVRKDMVGQLFHLAVLAGIGDSVDGKEDMEFWPWSFAAFFLHMVAAIVNRKGHTRECVSNIGRIDPLFRIVAVVIVAVNRQAIRADKVLVATVIALILCTDIIVCYRLKQSVLTGDLDLV